MIYNTGFPKVLEREGGGGGEGGLIYPFDCPCLVSVVLVISESNVDDACGAVRCVGSKV